MVSPRTGFPPVRACLFDMDGLLIDSEDLYSLVINKILHEYGKPSLPWSLKAQLQGRPAPEAIKIFNEWAQLPISSSEFLQKQAALQQIYFPTTKPLPGVPELLRNLSRTSSTSSPIYMAVATSSTSKNYALKTTHLAELFSVFPPSCVVKGDDPRIGAGRGKPLPDIYLLALETINEGIRAENKSHGGEGDAEITPEECLVFEDSVPGVEAARRAGMRVIWCPYEGLLKEYKGREEEVLSGLTGEHKDVEPVLDRAALEPWRRCGAGTPGMLIDGWGQLLNSLESFPYERYGMNIPS